MTFPLDASEPGDLGGAVPGGRMLRVTAWTVGLFGAGTALARAVAAQWAEPVVLIALGLAFLFVSARVGAVRPASPVAKLPARAPVAAAQDPAPAPVPVEQSA